MRIPLDACARLSTENMRPPTKLPGSFSPLKAGDRSQTRSGSQPAAASAVSLNCATTASDWRECRGGCQTRWSQPSAGVAVAATALSRRNGTPHRATDRPARVTWPSVENAPSGPREQRGISRMRQHVSPAELVVRPVGVLRAACAVPAALTWSTCTIIVAAGAKPVRTRPSADSGSSRWRYPASEPGSSKPGALAWAGAAEPRATPSGATTAAPAVRSRVARPARRRLARTSFASALDWWRLPCCGSVCLGEPQRPPRCCAKFRATGESTGGCS